jgi:hypothetical protein
VPPGYDWPTHGGYLGCLLGLMAACLIGGFAGKLVGLFTFAHNITGVPNVLLILATILVAVFTLGRIGWVLGRRFYREYSVKPTWGEDDAFRPEWEVRGEAGADVTDVAEDGRDAEDAGIEEGTDAPAGAGETAIGELREPLAEDAPANRGA